MTIANHIKILLPYAISAHEYLRAIKNLFKSIDKSSIDILMKKNDYDLI